MKKNKLLLTIFIAFVVIDLLIFTFIYFKYLSPTGLNLFSHRQITTSDFAIVFDNSFQHDPFKLRNPIAISRFSVGLRTNDISVKSISFNMVYDTRQVNYHYTFITPENIFMNQKVVTQPLRSESSKPSIMTIHFELSNSQNNTNGIAFGDFAVVGYQNIKTPDNINFLFTNIKLITTSNQIINMPDKTANFVF